MLDKTESVSVSVHMDSTLGIYVILSTVGNWNMVRVQFPASRLALEWLVYLIQ